MYIRKEIETGRVFLGIETNTTVEPIVVLHYDDFASLFPSFELAWLDERWTEYKVEFIEIGKNV